jgi:hypothetical protein
MAKKYKHLLISSIWHERISAASARERRTLIEVAEFALKAYLEANHPEILKEFVEEIEAEKPVDEVKPPEKKSKKS